MHGYVNRMWRLTARVLRSMYLELAIAVGHMAFFTVSQKL